MFSHLICFHEERACLSQLQQSLIVQSGCTDTSLANALCEREREREREREMCTQRVYTLEPELTNASLETGVDRKKKKEDSCGVGETHLQELKRGWRHIGF